MADASLGLFPNVNLATVADEVSQRNEARGLDTAQKLGLFTQNIMSTIAGVRRQRAYAKHAREQGIDPSDPESLESMALLALNENDPAMAMKLLSQASTLSAAQQKIAADAASAYQGNVIKAHRADTERMNALTNQEKAGILQQRADDQAFYIRNKIMNDQERLRIQDKLADMKNVSAEAKAQLKRIIDNYAARAKEFRQKLIDAKTPAAVIQKQMQTFDFLPEERKQIDALQRIPFMDSFMFQTFGSQAPQIGNPFGGSFGGAPVDGGVDFGNLPQ